MNAEIMGALDQLEKEKGIPKEYMLDKITQALLAAYKKDHTGYTENVTVNIIDVLETSDLPFVIQESESADAILAQATMPVTLALISRQDEVLALRQLTLGNAESSQVKAQLKRILEAGYEAEVSNHQIDKTQARYQPYELEEKALFTAAF